MAQTDGQMPSQLNISEPSSLALHLTGTKQKLNLSSLVGTVDKWDKLAAELKEQYFSLQEKLTRCDTLRMTRVLD